ncbi:helix-turn-helix domain-containing protein [Veillonella sp. VA142]|uniref:helix-turn-helix domain-containing protein n=1 Tax=Veillonella sp. VA142 TaxID=741834 RepID=UPI000F8CACFF|nr:helix-turn-helix domain-containing protein [Veillonella sp. VA142]
MYNNSSLEVLTVDDVADILHISKTIAYKLIRSGTIPGFKVNKRGWRVSKDSLAEYYKSQSKLQYNTP